jgi:hypothetical protein
VKMGQYFVVLRTLDVVNGQQFVGNGGVASGSDAGP